MSPSRSTARLHRLRRHAAAPWVCALLCLTTWRGPLPWVHEHAGARDRGQAPAVCCDPALGQHLVRFHDPAEGPSSADDEGWLGWHLHVFPMLSVALGDTCSDPQPTPRDPLSEFGVPVSIAADGPQVDSPLSGQGLFGKLASFDPHRAELRDHFQADREPAPDTFLTSLLRPAVPARAITGVALC